MRFTKTTIKKFNNLYKVKFNFNYVDFTKLLDRLSINNELNCLNDNYIYTNSKYRLNNPIKNTYNEDTIPSELIYYISNHLKFNINNLAAINVIDIDKNVGVHEDSSYINMNYNKGNYVGLLLIDSFTDFNNAVPNNDIDYNSIDYYVDGTLYTKEKLYIGNEVLSMLFDMSKPHALYTNRKLRAYILVFKNTNDLFNGELK